MPGTSNTLQEQAPQHATDPKWPTRELFGIPVQALTMEQAVALGKRSIDNHERLLIGVLNAAKIVSMRSNPELDRAVRSANLILADGMSVVWASRILKRPLPERVTGIDLMMRLLELSDQHGYSVYLLGATQAVLDTVSRRIAQDYPRARIVGQHHGYFSSDEEQEMVDEIAACRPDMLFAAMSSPKKEAFLARWSPKIDAAIAHGVGGAFDVMAGKTRRAPQRWQDLGLEWLYRLLQEPGRLWRRYLVTNTRFTILVLAELGAAVLPTRTRKA